MTTIAADEIALYRRWLARLGQENSRHDDVDVIAMVQDVCNFRWACDLFLQHKREEAFQLWFQIYDDSKADVLGDLAGFLVHWCYAAGVGIASDWNEAEFVMTDWEGKTQLHRELFEWCQEGNGRGNWFCEFLLAQCWIHSIGAPSCNLQYASSLLEQLALEGRAVAQCALADCIQERFTKSSADQMMMTHLYFAAANQGYADAMYKLAHCVEAGLGATSDIRVAKYFYQLAVDHGHTAAGDSLKLLDLLL
ncbi:uncharacterized protein BJ171DRAFT_591825 [Polychytrium aggregatum]|uniref:uncharacterized protein n=1 Tax=Polychytrium aggregatum TaxID=110093 RepID=UPI0022FE888F|nr:uncharacterized protein BJ171DRAFT_591825 [Polychytrium aggregatum]KAI9190564.1 hypothetical protein BJ171DRAFT_591825 [Polychytrium aggregatum]